MKTASIQLQFSRAYDMLVISLCSHGKVVLHWENVGDLRHPCPRRNYVKKVIGSPYSITERTVLELIPVLGSQPAGDVSHKPDGRLPLLSARPAVTPATLKRAATNFAAW